MKSCCNITSVYKKNKESIQKQKYMKNVHNMEYTENALSRAHFKDLNL